MLQCYTSTCEQRNKSDCEEVLNMIVLNSPTDRESDDTERRTNTLLVLVFSWDLLRLRKI